MVASLRFQAKLARRTLRRFNQMARYRRLSLGEVPILFANSFPKSGTHLLTQVLQGFTRLGPVVDSGLPAIVTYDGPTGEPRPAGSILNDLNRLLPGDIGYGHLHATPEIVAYLCQDSFVSYFILRDPRDVVVSHVHYVTDMAPKSHPPSLLQRRAAQFRRASAHQYFGPPGYRCAFPGYPGDASSRLWAGWTSPRS